MKENMVKRGSHMAKSSVQFFKKCSTCFYITLDLYWQTKELIATYYDEVEGNNNNP